MSLASLGPNDLGDNRFAYFVSQPHGGRHAHGIHGEDDPNPLGRIKAKFRCEARATPFMVEESAVSDPSELPSQAHAEA